MRRTSPSGYLEAVREDDVRSGAEKVTFMPFSQVSIDVWLLARGRHEEQPLVLEPHEK